jgi:hypothetical protein
VLYLTVVARKERGGPGDPHRGQETMVERQDSAGGELEERHWEGR